MFIFSFFVLFEECIDLPTYPSPPSDWKRSFSFWLSSTNKALSCISWCVYMNIINPPFDTSSQIICCLLEAYQKWHRRVGDCGNQAQNPGSMNIEQCALKCTSKRYSVALHSFTSFVFAVNWWVVSKSSLCCLFCHVWRWVALTAVCLWATLVQTSWRPR